MEFVGTITMLVDTQVDVQRYLDHLQTNNIAQTTINNRRDILIPFFRKVEKPVLDVTFEDIERYLFTRAVEIKQSSLQMEKQALRGFFKYCYEYCEMDLQFRWDVIQRKKVKPAKVTTFEPEQVARVVASCREQQDRLIISLMFESGIRISEVLNLEVRDIEGTAIHVRGKGENDRMIFMTRELARAIHAYAVRKDRYSGRVFRPLQISKNHSGDRYVSAYGVRDRIEAAFAKCGYSMHPHQLRHSFSKNWLMQGGDLRTLQILLGHADLTTTQRYLGLTDKETEAIYHRVQVRSVLAAA